MSGCVDPGSEWDKSEVLLVSTWENRWCTHPFMLYSGTSACEPWVLYNGGCGDVLRPSHLCIEAGLKLQIMAIFCATCSECWFSPLSYWNTGHTSLLLPSELPNIMLHIAKWCLLLAEDRNFRSFYLYTSILHWSPKGKLLLDSCTCDGATGHLESMTPDPVVHGRLLYQEPQLAQHAFDVIKTLDTKNVNCVPLQIIRPLLISWKKRPFSNPLSGNMWHESVWDFDSSSPHLHVYIQVMEQTYIHFIYLKHSVHSSVLWWSL